MESFRDIPALDIFPARVRRGVKTITPADDGVRSGKFVPASGEVTIPIGNSAYERTVRLHESLHALHSAPCGTGELHEQAFEDMRLHMRHAHTEGGVKRDEIATALIDLRSMAQTARQIRDNEEIERGGWGSRKHQINRLRYQGAAIMARSMAILTKSDRGYNHAVYEAEKLIGLPVVERLNDAIDYMKAGQDDKAKSELERLFKGLDPEPKPEPDPTPPAIKKSSKVKDLLAKLKGERRAKKGHGATEEGEYTPPPPTGVSKGLEKEIREAMAQDDRYGYGRMTIRRLEMKEPKDGYGPTERMQVAGMRIRAKKLASVAASPSPGRVFIRKIHKQGGTALIDASGSMSLSNPALRKIAEQVPAGTVAYYSGNNSRGDLVIYAEKGKQYAKEGALPYRNGGNEIDMAALLWLLNQPGPRYMVTDGGFCGENASVAAKKLLNAAVKQKRVKWVRSLKDLQKELGGKKGKPTKACPYPSCGSTNLKPYPGYEATHVICQGCGSSLQRSQLV